ASRSAGAWGEASARPMRRSLLHADRAADDPAQAARRVLRPQRHDELALAAEAGDQQPVAREGAAVPDADAQLPRVREPARLVVARDDRELAGPVVADLEADVDAVRPDLQRQ